MPRFYTVSKAFQGKDRETGEPEVINTKGGEAHKWLVQVEDQPVHGWFSVLKKPGNEVKPGDQLYGVIEENNYGKPQFTRMQAPQDGQGQTQSAPTQATSSQPAGSVEEKLDYLISLVENFLDAQDSGRKAQTGTDAVPKDIDDGPVDLSQLDY